ncbi:IS3 family transposase [Pseudomonas aeruginosa]|nr:IS3 family transposase [Pseudomonas aeruginosa]MCO3707735.1 IS3 family transposase [Pseudomonas aeruginosa]
MTKQRRTFTPEFKREAACLVLDQGYSHAEAARSLGLVESALRRWVNQLQQERGGVTPASKALTPEQQKIQELEARITRLEREKSIPKKGYRALDVGRSRAYALIRQLSDHEPVDCLCEVFEVTRSSYYAHRHRRRTPDVERLRLRSRVNELFTRGRSAPGSRTIMAMMQEEGEQIGRFKVRSLMRELALISKQPGSHAYKKATVERPDIPNTLNRAFDVEAPNQVWCGDITYVWAQGKWHYLAVVLDLYARRVVGWALSEKPDGDLVVNVSWLDCAERYDRAHTFFYMDPPYWQTAGYGVDFPFEEYERMADFMRRCKGRVMVSINDHPDIRRAFDGFHFEHLDIRYSNTNQRQGKAEVTGELVIMNWRPSVLEQLF